MSKFIIGLAVVMLMTGCISTERYARAILGEAEDQGFRGMLAVACGIRNRPEGLEGVRGVHSNRIFLASKESKELARQAWRFSALPENCSFIGNADMWENTEEFGNPKDWPAVHFITKIGNHNFYRRITTNEN